MTIFDTDVLSEILRGNTSIIRRATVVPRAGQAISVVTAEEIVRGRLQAIREAQSRRDPTALVIAYGRFAETVDALKRVRIVRHSEAAESQFAAWRAARIKVAPNDLRIAAIAHVLGATLVTCNRKDFQLVPQLRVEYWPEA